MYSIVGRLATPRMAMRVWISEISVNVRDSELKECVLVSRIETEMDGWLSREIVVWVCVG